jgi:hypothetical protein
MLTAGMVNDSTRGIPQPRATLRQSSLAGSGVVFAQAANRVASGDPRYSFQAEEKRGRLGEIVVSGKRRQSFRL